MTFLDPSLGREVSEDFYDAKRANIIGDWEQTITRATDFIDAVKKGLAHDEDMILMKDLLSGKRKVDASKAYTIYRSTGTPIQNLAVLQALLASEK
jgi:ornithine cyclodeaminase/alanine dehydrogenase-like protein (mu-crystallin family)